MKKTNENKSESKKCKKKNREIQRYTMWRKRTWNRATHEIVAIMKTRNWLKLQINHISWTKQTNQILTAPSKYYVISIRTILSY